jgi:hypothetical protein
VRPNIGYSLFVEANILNNVEGSIASFVFLYYIINTIWYFVVHCITFLVALHIGYLKMNSKNLLGELPYLILKVDDLHGNMLFSHPGFKDELIKIVSKT